jgi:L-serine kinase (ATP) / ParB family transcriptional regulator, heme-responsive regulator
MLAELPTLTFLSVEALIIHERHDDQRTRPLILRIRNSGVFRNPPIVCPLQDGSGRYMVLDGANRTTALQEMGFQHALVQVVQPDHPGLSLQNWNHVVWELSPDRFLSGIHDLPGIRMTLEHAPNPETDLTGDCGLALVCSCNGHTYSLCTAADDLETRVEQLNLIVDSYKDRARLDRTSSRDVNLLGQIYPQFSGLVIFPNFKIEDVMQLAGEGYMLPSGLTRFTISPRALHLNYPLEELASDAPLEVKNQRLHKWLQERLERKSVRYYAEATFLFDE